MREEQERYDANGNGRERSLSNILRLRYVHEEKETGEALAVIHLDYGDCPNCGARWAVTDVDLDPYNQEVRIYLDCEPCGDIGKVKVIRFYEGDKTL